MATMNQARRILRDDGLQSLFYRGARLIRRKILISYYRRSGERTIHMKNIDATFGTEGRSSKSLQYFIETEEQILADLLAELNQSDTVWDVGSNIGFFSCFVGQRATVVPFDPSPLVAERCDKNLKRNGINTKTKRIGLSNTEEVVTIEQERSPELSLDLWKSK